MLLVDRMGALPADLRARIREMSLGPIAWGSWSWTFHDGSCWVALAFEGDEPVPRRLLAWAALTKETDRLPVIGAYTHLDWRRLGLAERAVDALLGHVVGGGHLAPGDEVFASTWRWPRWHGLLERHGLRCVTWA